MIVSMDAEENSGFANGCKCQRKLWSWFRLTDNCILELLPSKFPFSEGTKNVLSRVVKGLKCRRYLRFRSQLFQSRVSDAWYVDSIDLNFNTSDKLLDDLYSKFNAVV